MSWIQFSHGKGLRGLAFPDVWTQWNWETRAMHKPPGCHGLQTAICLSRIFLRSGLAVHKYLAGKPLPQKAFAEGAFTD